ncbi:uncharacterized protein HMPREF1541_10400 [Cyphellophora europaea CBS 101466]|uniref:Aminotransferase class I/classII large domain-containing protein n=1 Tax=Cyphellophora europaea (strain CBS 101466) TaxID=1220924 RepID=W2S7X1_CYPE1|nr:uncharacterized protein HMPREF1541_10400 [Cyphellophora europaea CBS 101466]ETN44730.1 hypothetical protein HMPREF1541_10400 [Cyphellophora europaea CBS 101466]
MGSSQPEPFLSARVSSNLVSSKLGEVRSHCFYNQWHPTTNPDGIIALAIAENKLMRDEIVDHINANFKITPWHLTYGEGPQGSIALKSAIGDFMNREFNPFTPLNKDHIVVCNGAGSAVNNLCFCLGEPGDGILVGRPLYTGFFPDIEAYAKFKLLGVPFGDIDPVSPAAAACYEATLQQAESNGTKVRALLIANPHNPLGRPYPPATLLALVNLCSKHNLHLISDEVYCKSHFPSHDFPAPPPFTSVLSLPLPQHINPALVHVIYALSKDFCANGLRIGCVASPSNPRLVRALRSIASFTRASQLAEHAWLNLLTDTPWQATYFPELQRRMRGAYEYVTGLLREEGVPYGPASVSSFLWVDLRRYLAEQSWEAEVALNWRLAREGKVWVAAGGSFGAEAPGWGRITFATPREELRDGMGRILGVLRTVETELREVGSTRG